MKIRSGGQFYWGRRCSNSDNRENSNKATNGYRPYEWPFSDNLAIKYSDEILKKKSRYVLIGSVGEPDGKSFLSAFGLFQTRVAKWEDCLRSLSVIFAETTLYSFKLSRTILNPPNAPKKISITKNCPLNKLFLAYQKEQYLQVICFLV